jgi:hypothetical protein
MLKSEYAQQQVKEYLTDVGGPVKLASLITRVDWLTDDGDPRWIVVALLRLHQTGQARYPAPGCGDNHDHDDECTVVLT